MLTAGLIGKFERRAQEIAIRYTACSSAEFKIRALYDDFYTPGKINFNTEYQRSEVWKLPKQQLLIDSVLRNYDISKIFLRQLLDGSYECLDGQQRLKAIFNYLEDKFRLSKNQTLEIGALKFIELDDELKWRIWNYTIYATIVHNVDDATTCTIFLRLQEGMPLNSAEKLNAILGQVHDIVVDLAHHNFFSLTGLSEYRFSRRYNTAQILLLESQGHATNIKFRNLKQMCLSTPGVLKPDSVKRVLNYLVREFGGDASIIVNSADFIILFMVASTLIKSFPISQYQGTLRDFFKEFLVRVGQTIGAQTEEDLPFWNYKTLRKTSADSKTSLEQRHEIVLSEFLKKYAAIPCKDAERDFNYWQKLAIYNRAKGYCQGNCSPRTQLRFKDGQYHHIHRWADGGPTTVENGQLLCVACHQHIHSTHPDE